MKWIKLTDKEPKFGEKYLLQNDSGEFFIGNLLEKKQNEHGKFYIFYNNETQLEVGNISYYIKIELAK